MPSILIHLEAKHDELMYTYKIVYKILKCG